MYEYLIQLNPKSEFHMKFKTWRDEKKWPFVHVDIGFLADDIGESATNTLDGSEGKHDLLLPIDVGVEHTKNVLKFLVCNKRLQNPIH